VRVLHVITGLAAGGAEQQLASLLRHTRHTAEVVSLTDVGSVGRRILANGVTVHAVRMQGNRDLAALPALTSLIRRGGYDLVHVHLYRACVYGRIAAWLARVPTIVTTEHSLGDTHLEGRAVTPAVRALYLATARLSDVTIAVSPTVQRRLEDLGVPARRIVMIPNGLDGARLRFESRARDHARTELGLSPDALVIGSVGRLHPVKRFDALLAAAAPRLREGAHLLLVGAGPEREVLEQQARTLGVSAQLVLPGERDDVARLLSAMDVYAAPSRDETFGLAVLEALANGLPAVVGRCPALDGIELSQVHRVATPDDLPGALDAAVRWSRSSAGVRTPPAVLDERFDIRAVSASTDELYERLDARRTRSVRNTIRRVAERRASPAPEN
jgi:glycosyltransferase involved in cell wall biosynthesis